MLPCGLTSEQKVITMSSLFAFMFFNQISLHFSHYT